MPRTLSRVALAASWTLLSLVPPRALAGQSGQANPKGNSETGKTVWAGLACRNCHGQTGEGAFGPALAGRFLTFEQFEAAVRHPSDIMPAYTPEQLSQQGITDLVAYFEGLPRAGGEGPWRTPLPPGAPKGQQLLIATYGCGQCHGPQAAMMRTIAGGEAGDYAWFTRRVYEHTTTMPPHEPNPRMGNYSRSQVPETDLKQLWQYISVDLGLRAPVRTQLRSAPASAGFTYTLTVQNSGEPGKGPTAEDLLVSLELPEGAEASNPSGAGYQGVRRDDSSKMNVAVWRLDRLAPTEKQAYAITLSQDKTGRAITGGSVSWVRPTLPSGVKDSVAVAPVPAQPQ